MKTSGMKRFHFPDCLKVSSMVSEFKNVMEQSTDKNYHSVSLSFVASEFLNTMLANSTNVGFFLISSTILGVLDQLQIF